MTLAWLFPFPHFSVLDFRVAASHASSLGALGGSPCTVQESREPLSQSISGLKLPSVGGGSQEDEKSSEKERTEDRQILKKGGEVEAAVKRRTAVKTKMLIHLHQVLPSLALGQMPSVVAYASNFAKHARSREPRLGGCRVDEALEHALHNRRALQNFPYTSYP